MASVYKLSAKEILEIKKVRKMNKDKRAEKRLYALEMQEKGSSTKELFQTTSFHSD